ncbi:hypothetical protein SAMN05421788_102122 [Filimonas lacunae]|uniref:Short-chain dehydrogenase n=1 Tax=Filimonas lacunae TaxID=477680 RepID=A0A173MI31_9BACT|nr:SDR family oxidoreductase [Filimonas lacunae]BAV07255.1 short-chain dehydrogenase/reductase SDR [Filimonas lacunae]SIS92497.1 hypothetical protein SAMN05421788_102122 [Filimonas lacunae]
MQTIKGKTALVTGASSGIGKALAYQLAQQGANLVITARSVNKLEIIATSIREKCKVTVEVITADLSLPDAAKDLVNAIAGKGIGIDILVNNAGFGKWAPFLREEESTYMQMIQLNISALVQLSWLLLPGMLKRGSGGVINIASTGAFQPCSYIAVYCASKAFVLSFSEALYGEYKSKGITVTAVCPGNTQTEFATTANAQTEGMAFASAEAVAKESLQAFIKEKNYIVTGGVGNYIQSLSARFLPRKTMINIVAGMFSKRVGAA